MTSTSSTYLNVLAKDGTREEILSALSSQLEKNCELRNQLKDMQSAWFSQREMADRYGIALMMIREGVADPIGHARRILSEFEASTIPDGEAS